ncbi:hypothetical protein [Streptomyces meridianus]|uniref:Secreted protein n=1 Tax=Streptomyces meridianus TaxID=2938945 RepID=A0ABT0X3L4_9ACTN|nr:hypothetical protein [Streptomyces meridianus]MCM2577126.1 hypothetical protein [Streptomyces meridianus]
MNWGCAAALGLSLLALVISIKALADAKRPRTLPEKSSESQRPGAPEAAETEAVTAAAEGARPAAGGETGPADGDPAQEGVELDVQHVENDLYRLRNNGSVPAVNIVFDEERLPAVFLVRAAGEVSLQRDETIDFVMAGSVDKPLEQELLASWDGQQTPVALQVPVKASAARP